MRCRALSLPFAERPVLRRPVLRRPEAQPFSTGLPLDSLHSLPPPVARSMVRPGPPRSRRAHADRPCPVPLDPASPPADSATSKIPTKKIHPLPAAILHAPPSAPLAVDLRFSPPPPRPGEGDHRSGVSACRISALTGFGPGD
ncbi:hypothetical protein SLNWT_3293 [Streptomyces albus]|uniref:Uncharacterized protein n=1 Tax=Streptomyces albus (strain ATCC 21838 / DSM 41398 / FERM P-419 / JCM 4703 / NBRC 107858) TaxID=1081613 RepID=A0A0B5EPW8_STRA4|nr:hypothetical protein SLNWT_3293 [Streptomyces albus]AOU77977.1 hypothetical protein SLNHY_3286 [Streptomyces albus]AYN33732.1 hypothetical protein DUI70_3231 [Streptomyces albus]